MIVIFLKILFTTNSYKRKTESHKSEPKKSKIIRYEIWTHGEPWDLWADLTATASSEN